MSETSTYTPSIQTHSKPEGAAGEVCVESGGGSSYPGSCESPASVGSESAHSTSAQDRNLFIESSPVVEVTGRGGFTARTVQISTPDDPDLALFRALADRQDFDSLTGLCRERLTAARDGAASLRWTKDLAIVNCLQGDYTAAYDLLASAHFLASGVVGVPRAKYEDEFGIVLARLGRSSLALEHFDHSYQEHRGAGSLRGCACVDHNRARALLTRGETEKAGRYLRRALEYARANDDFRLEKEICETILEFDPCRI